MEGVGNTTVSVSPEALPRFLGRSLYWVGVQVEILALARRTDFSEGISLAIAVTVAALVVGLMLAWISVMDLPASFLDRFKLQIVIAELVLPSDPL